MGDFYIEENVERKFSAAQKTGSIVGIVLSIVGVFCTPLILIPIFLITLVLSVFIYLNHDIEFEYLYELDELEVDKILRKKKRRKVGKYRMSQVVVIAPLDSREILKFDHERPKVKDVSSKKADHKRYAMILKNNNQTTKLIFEPSREMLEKMREKDTQKVFL